MYHIVFYFVVLPSISAYTYVQKKFQYVPGIVCNYEIYPTITNVFVARYYCVPERMCHKDRLRTFSMPQPEDYCNYYLTHPQGDLLTCCHFDDVTTRNTEVWHRSKLIVPGLRSYLMCRDHAHTLCTSDGRNYCFESGLSTTQGTPTVIYKYPHTALVGYNNDSEWVWFCRGALISKRFVLTAAKCCQQNPGQELHVRVGEERLCDYCQPLSEEQTVRVETLHVQPTDNYYYNDVGLLQLSADIQFNILVRPACLFTEYKTRQAQAWFTTYGNIKAFIITPRRVYPTFMFLKDIPQKDFQLSFKVKASEEAILVFSKTGMPYQHEENLQIFIGNFNNTMSMIKGKNSAGSDEGFTSYPSEGVLSDKEYRGFWVKMNGTSVTVGREYEDSPLVRKTVDTTDYELMGIQTPNCEGAWIFPDHATLFSLHEDELQVSYSEQCQQYYQGSPSLDQEGINDDIMFCAGNLNTGTGPCKFDGGGTLQVMDDKESCMWKVVGVAVRDENRNCSDVQRPAMFNSITPHLEWIENIAFADFDVYKINEDVPECTLPENERDKFNRC